MRWALFAPGSVRFLMNVQAFQVAYVLMESWLDQCLEAGCQAASGFMQAARHGSLTACAESLWALKKAVPSEAFRKGETNVVASVGKYGGAREAAELTVLYDFGPEVEVDRSFALELYSHWLPARTGRTPGRKPFFAQGRKVGWSSWRTLPCIPALLLRTIIAVARAGTEPGITGRTGIAGFGSLAPVFCARSYNDGGEFPGQRSLCFYAERGMSAPAADREGLISSLSRWCPCSLSPD